MFFWLERHDAWRVAKARNGAYNQTLFAKAVMRKIFNQMLEQKARMTQKMTQKNYLSVKHLC